MRNYPKKRKHCGYAKCNIYGKTFIARGIGTHIREAHNMVVKVVVRNSNYYSKNNLITAVNDYFTAEKDYFTGGDGYLTTVNVNNAATVGTVAKNTTTFYPTSNHEISEISDKDLKGCNQTDIIRLYTDTDLWIFYGRCRFLLYSHKYLPHEIKRYLIQDFENRFKCTPDEAIADNPHICPKKAFAENPDLPLKYGIMEYSK